MKSTIFLALVFALSGCSERSNSRPTSTVIKPPSAPAPNTQNQPSTDEVAARVQFEKAKELLLNMGVKVDGKDIVVSTQPNSYKDTKDLKMAFDTYERAAKEMVNTARAPEAKVVWQSVADSAASMSAKYIPQSIFLKEFAEISIHEDRLEAYGIHFKEVDNNWVMAIDKEFSEHYPRSEHRRELKSFIERIENFLQVYLDGQSPINLLTKVTLEKKAALAKDLAATLN